MLSWIDVLIVLLLMIGFATLLSGIFTVEQESVAIIETFGKFNRIAHAGLNFKIPWIQSRSDAFSLKIQQLDIETETKTKDNVFVLINISVQYNVLRDAISTAFYRLSDPKPQLVNYINNSIRSSIPSLGLDDVFSQKDTIANTIRDGLTTNFKTNGYEIEQILITDIKPDAKVQEAMNEINAQTRLKEAATQKGEGDKILMVKAAEAEAESKRLQGEGIAAQRKAIIDGLKGSIEEMKEATGIDSETVMQTIMMTQYFDTIKEVGTNGKSHTILLPSNPGGVKSIGQEMREAILATHGDRT